MPNATLADRLLAEKRILNFPKALPDVRAARRFVFDRDASRLIGRVIAEAPDLIAEHQEFAIPPFPKTWIEVAIPDLLDGINGTTTAAKYGDQVDTVCGWLIRDGQALVAAMDPSGQAGFSGFKYRLHHGAAAPANPGERDLVDGLIWGSSLTALSREAVEKTRAAHGVELAERLRNGAPEKIQRMYEGHNGDLRILLATLLMLNRPSRTTFETEEVGATRGIHRGRSRTFLSHTTVKLRLSPDIATKALRAHVEEGALRRRHEVRGHFAHDRTTRANRHEHVWERLDENQWVCSRCGGKRWWRRPHARGSAEIGFNTKTWHVTG